jgi:hypothetical protein
MPVVSPLAPKGGEGLNSRYFVDPFTGFAGASP